MNFIELEEEHARAYMKPEFLEFLSLQKFDVGLGSILLADSLLFRALDLQYIKLSSEDIEAYTMQFKLGIPVQLSAYPSIETVSNYDYDDFPGFNSHVYRQKFNKDYLFSSMIRKVFLKKMANHIPEHLRQKLLFSFDQDHALILGEGTKHGLF